MTLITADLHLNDRPRDSYRHEFLRTHLPALMRKHKATRLYILGDLCDDKTRHDAWLVNAVVHHLEALSELCPVYVLKGNHDYIAASTPFFEFLGRIQGRHPIHWIGTPTTVKDPELGRVVLLPHTTNPARDWVDLDFTAADVVFAHQTFAGAQVGPRKMEGVSPSIFPRRLPVYSGDIHVPQTFGYITYVGSPFTVDFGDAFESRVLVGSDLKSVRCPGVQKRLVEISDVAELKSAGMVRAGDLLKVRLTLSAADHARWPELQRQIRQAVEARGCSLWAVQPAVAREAVRSNAKRAGTVQTDEQLLLSYAKARAVGPDTLKTGQTLMRNA